LVHFFQAMSAAPDPAELAPSRDPAAYGRRPLRASGFAGWLVLCLICLVGGGAIGRFGFPAVQTVPPQLSAPEVVHASPTTPSPVGAAPPAAPPAGTPSAQDSAGDSALSDRVSRLEGAASRQDVAGAEALAAASLSVASQGSAPFDRDLAAYERLAPGDPDLRALVPLALRGAPSRAALAASMPDFAAAAVVAMREPARDAGPLARFWALIGRVVIVRKVDPAGPGVDGVLARAQDEASVGDLEAAVQTLQRLPPVGRAQFADWLAAADRRIQIDQQVAAVRASALAALAPPPAPGASVTTPSARP
jgi:hypothetical protein